MVDFFKPIKVIGDFLQKPQSIATGALNEVTGQADDARRFIDQYEMALVPDTEENAVRYQAALAMVGNSESTGGSITNIGSALAGAARGAQGNLRPSDMITADTGSQNGLLTNAANIGLDPLMVVGGVGGVPKVLQGTQAGKLAKAAGTFGSLGKEASKAEKAAQVARRAYQGALVSGGDPAVALGATLALQTAESAGSRLLGRLATRAADDIAGNALERELSRPGAELIDEQYETALRTIAQDMPEASSLRPGDAVEGPGFAIPQTRVPAGQEIVPWQPGMTPPLSQDPAVALVRQALQERGDLVTNPRAVGDIFGANPLQFRGAVESNRVLGELANEFSVGQARGGLRQREVFNPMNRQQVPFSDQGAQFNAELMQQGMPVPPRDMPALPSGETGTLPAVPQEMFAGIQQLPEELLRMPVPQATGRLAVNPMMEADPALLQRMAGDFLGTQGTTPLPTRPPWAPPADTRFMPASLSQTSQPQITPEEAMAVVEQAQPVAQPSTPRRGSKEALQQLNLDQLQKRADKLRSLANRGDKRAIRELETIEDVIESYASQGESPMDRFLRLATSG